MENSGGVRNFFSVFSWGMKIFCLNFMGYEFFFGLLEFHSAPVPGIKTGRSLRHYSRIRRCETMSDTRSMVMTLVRRCETMSDTRSMVMTLVRRFETMSDIRWLWHYYDGLRQCRIPDRWSWHHTSHVPTRQESKILSIMTSMWRDERSILKTICSHIHILHTYRCITYVRLS